MYIIIFILTIFLIQIINADGIRGLVCEHETLELKCPKNSTIKILTALYGKKNPQYCFTPGGSSLDCVAGKALDIVKFRCNRKQICYLNASNQLFGDPCLGTFKYLEVTYDCVDGDTSTLVVCENDKLEIKCSNGTYIWITNALYGRTNQEYCGNESREILSNNCKANQALTVVESRCDTLQHCTIEANDGLFGDPCKGTYKYLEVDYQCLNHRTSFCH